jgi:pyruvate dehydrogenase E1 component beta subunit
MLHRAMNVAEALDKEGVSVEVVDLRCLVPLDTETVFESVRKTGRLVIVEESNDRGGWGAQVAADVAGSIMGYLDAPIRRVAAPDVPIPFAPKLENAVVPGEPRIRAAILDVMEGLR